MALQRLRHLATAPLLSDAGLLLALRSELNHELTSPSRREAIVPSGFLLEHDAPRSQDMLLRRRDAGSGEDVAVSALLGTEREVKMKVCVQKPGFQPVVRFDCCVFDRNGGEGEDGELTDFDVKGVWYHSSVGESGIERRYLGPDYSTLDPELQQAFKRYLVSRGVTTELMDFLLKHLHNKEQGQYVNWLRILEASFAKDS